MKFLIYGMMILISINLLLSQDVTVIDSDSNTLIQINDEGDGGSITLPEANKVEKPIDKLYNEGGILKWDESALSTGSHTTDTNAATNCSPGEILTGDGSCIPIPSGGDDADWTISGDNIYSTPSGKVGIGTTNPFSKLSVGGAGSFSATIYGESTGSAGKGVFGIATYDNFGQNYGGYFQANGQSGIGVYGESSYTGNAVNYGGSFKAGGGAGIGVHGSATHYTGANYGILAQTNSPNGWAGYFQGRGYFSDKLGVGTTNPQSMLEVHGYIQIDTVTGAPPAADCDESIEAGRMKFDDSSDILYICSGVSGWVSK